MDADKLAQLRTEVEADPQGIGYAKHIEGARTTLREAGQIADLMNAPHASASLAARRVTFGELDAVVDLLDLPPQMRAVWLLLRSLSQPIDPRLILSQVNDTRGSATSLQQMASKRGSRAEALFGADAMVSARHVFAALNPEATPERLRK